MSQFWESILNSSALILGLVISLNTVYSIIWSQMVKRRQFRMMIEELRLAFGIHLELIMIISGKADRFLKEDMPKPIPRKLPALSQKSKDALDVIASRAAQILASAPVIDLSNWAGLLKKKQLEKLMDFLEAYQLYRVRLELRLEEYKAAPEHADVLGRFLSSAVLHEGLNEKFVAFESSLGVKPKQKQNDE